MESLWKVSSVHLSSASFLPSDSWMWDRQLKPLATFWPQKKESQALKKKPPQKPVKKAPVKKKEDPPDLSDRWVSTATRQGYNTVCASMDSILAEIVVAWAQDDNRKAVAYFFGAMQGLATQLGRLESILIHSGHVPMVVTKEARRMRFTDAFESICANMEHAKDEHGLLVGLTIKEIIDIISASSGSPGITDQVEKTPANVIRLPVFRKE